MAAALLRLLAMVHFCDAWGRDGNARTAPDAPSSLNDMASRTSWMHPGPCTIPRVNRWDLPTPVGAMDTPVVIVMSNQGENDRRPHIDERYNAKFASLVTRASLMSRYRDLPVVLTSSNSYSQGCTESFMGVYLEAYLTPHTAASIGLNHSASAVRSANETLYMFGSHRGAEWEALLRQYQTPPCSVCDNPDDAALSFGIGDVGSGVSWHVHGPGYSEVLHGRKRWLLYPPHTPPPEFHPNMTTLTWTTEVLPRLLHPTRHTDKADTSAHNSSQSMDMHNERALVPLVCDIEPGEVLYFPHMWHHATLNLSPYTAFVSTFTTQ